MNKTVFKVVNDLIGIWLGFCLGWVYFTDSNGWTVIITNIIGMVLIIGVGFLTNLVMMKRTKIE
jgi:putative flippase GtrA